MRERISQLEVQASKTASKLRGIGKPSLLAEVRERREWLRLKAWIDTSQVRGAGIRSEFGSSGASDSMSRSKTLDGTTVSGEQ